MCAESVDQQCEKVWTETSQEMQEAFWAKPEIEEQAVKEIQEQIESRDIGGFRGITSSRTRSPSGMAMELWSRL